MNTLFSEEELDLAQLFKALGLGWTPNVGHYVLDQSNVIECSSPFQDRVFFILDLKHFLRRCETLEGVIEKMCWLPTWEQARGILSSMQVDSQTIAERLVATKAIEFNEERLELYRLIEARMTGEI